MDRRDPKTESDRWMQPSFVQQVHLQWDRSPFRWSVFIGASLQRLTASAASLAAGVLLRRLPSHSAGICDILSWFFSPSTLPLAAQQQRNETCRILSSATSPWLRCIWQRGIRCEASLRVTLSVLVVSLSSPETKQLCRLLQCNPIVAHPVSDAQMN